MTLRDRHTPGIKVQQTPRPPEMARKDFYGMCKTCMSLLLRSAVAPIQKLLHALWDAVQSWMCTKMRWLRKRSIAILMHARHLYSERRLNVVSPNSQVVEPGSGWLSGGCTIASHRILDNSTVEH